MIEMEMLECVCVLSSLSVRLLIGENVNGLNDDAAGKVRRFTEGEQESEERERGGKKKWIVSEMH